MGLSKPPQVGLGATSDLEGSAHMGQVSHFCGLALRTATAVVRAQRGSVPQEACCPLDEDPGGGAVDDRGSWRVGRSLVKERARGGEAQILRAPQCRRV